MSYFEILRQSFKNVRKNLLRSVLTIMIIAFGIMALVGILTAIDTILFSMNDNFSSLGANSFHIKRKEASGSQHGRNLKQGEVISFRQAEEFAERFDFPGIVTLGFNATSNATIKFRNEKTNPTVGIRGIDHYFLDVFSFDLEAGRNFTRQESQRGGFKAILGSEIIELLFDGQEDKALGQTISIGSHKFKVVGILKSQGSSMTSNADRRVYIPLLTAKNLYGSENSHYYIDVATFKSSQLDDAMAYSTGLMRNVRRLKAQEENDFEIRSSAGLISILRDITFELRVATVAIGLMTLFGAAIGLMNIMLVSVTERTKEIGVIKALGATEKNIMTQFLTEATIICQLGGVAGIILGILIGNVVTWLIGGQFLIPWAWIILGLVVCLIVGIASGFYPALRAAKLDPIEALRYE
ncbi:MAG: ABC transporter permease [Saprospiraceae bacterium]|nr:ABC transporter permease [Saprospiraceae bacterium]